MKQIVTIFALLVCFAAQAYIPFISEDRIWEYFYDNGNTYGDQANELSKFKFDGTQELNGKTYHQLKYISLSHWKIEDGKLILSGEYDKPVNSIIALLREEDGVVYWNREIQKENSDNPEYEEVILYDFRHEPGEEFRAIGSDYLNSESWYYDIKYNEVPYLTVAADRCENWDGKHFIFRNLQSVEFTKQYDDLRWEERFGENFADVEIVEGLGNVGLGSIIHPDHIARMEYNSSGYQTTRLNNVYDLDGNIIYKGYNTDNPYLTTASENRTLRKDRVWRYYDYNNETIRSVKYDRDSVINDTVYYIYSMRYENQKLEMLLREENNRIYKRCKKFDGGNEYQHSDKDWIIYDFNLSENESYTPAFSWPSLEDIENGWIYTWEPTIVSQCLTLDVCGNELKALRVPNVCLNNKYTYHIEGIGTFDYGILGALMYGLWKSGGGGETFVAFQQMEDLDGNVLVTRNDIQKAIDKYNGVETVGADAEEGDGRMFDLMGRELRGEPARGTVYIQNGHKHIAR